VTWIPVDQKGVCGVVTAPQGILCMQQHPSYYFFHDLAKPLNDLHAARGIMRRSPKSSNHQTRTNNHIAAINPESTINNIKMMRHISSAHLRKGSAKLQSSSWYYLLRQVVWLGLLPVVRGSRKDNESSSDVP
jgi:hypothetical protein